MDVFREETQPVLEHYRDKNNVIYIDGIGPIEEVTKRILLAIEKNI